MTRIALLGCLLALTAAGCGSSSAARTPGSNFTLMQMNLCLSGLASCYGKVAYPGVVKEAVARIRSAKPDAVTFNEACRNDVASIARQTGYRFRFSTVIYGGKPFPCVQPGGRGVFGDAVLTKAAGASSEGKAFVAQSGPERRAWLCVTTRARVDVCTTHLATRDEVERPANGPQCSELRALLAARAMVPVIFGGDVNRHPSCAPAGFWTRTDKSAGQDPGSQHVYGSRAFRAPSARVVPATHTDHDILLVRARLTVRR